MIWTGYCNLMDNLKVLSTLEVNKTVNGLWRTENDRIPKPEVNQEL